MEQDDIDRLITRAGRFREIHVQSHHSAEIRRDMRTIHMRDNGASGEGGILLLVGASGSGKSKLLDDYASGFPDRPRAIVKPNGEFADWKEVVSFKAPDGNPKNVTEVWFAALTGQDIGHVVGRGAKRLVIQKDIVEVSREVRNKLTLIDEANQCIDNQEDRAAARIAGLLRDIVNNWGPSLVLAGTPSILRLCAVDSEFNRRAFLRHKLPPLDWDAKVDRDFFEDVLEGWDEHLRDNVFGVLSGLSKVSLAQPLWRAGGGYLGNVAALVEIATTEAVYDMVAGEADRLTYAHLTKAYAKSSLQTEDRKAFPAAPLPLPEEETAPTRLRGRTRRSDRHRIFRR